MPMKKTTSKNTTQWLRHRALGAGNNLRSERIQSSPDLMIRLQLETTLVGHEKCVNSIDWNQWGNLLASASDDRNVILWQAFRGRKQHVVATGHDDNIFSVKFLPNSGDAFIATGAADCQVRLTDSSSNKSLLNCSSCHLDRVKRIAVHPRQPHLIWSAAEDGYVMQYDVRERHICQKQLNSNRPKDLIIDLKTINPNISAKCLAINPVRDDMIAVGSNDIYNRLFDRRYLPEDATSACTSYFAPGHLIKSRKLKTNHPHSLGTTYLSFSSDGSELLATLHAEQVYMFNTYQPWERYKTFDSTLKPLLLDQQPARDATLVPGSKVPAITTRNQWLDLKRRRRKSENLESDLSEFIHCANNELRDQYKLPKATFDRINQLLLEVQDCPDLYLLRASALINRAWRGDFYQALRDCCCALALRPLDQAAIHRLAVVLSRSNDRNSANKLLEMLDMMMKQPENRAQTDSELGRTVRFLSAYKRNSVCSISHNNSTTLNDANKLMEDEADDCDIELNSQLTSDLANRLRTILPNCDTAPIACLTDDLLEHSQKVRRLCSNAHDFQTRYSGHCNVQTDIKEANFFGSDGEYIVGGSDDGAFYIWDKKTSNILKAVGGDSNVLNCVQPHPRVSVLATSGIDSTVKIWSTSGKQNFDVESLESRCSQNQEYMSIDPLEAMIMMLYPDRVRD